MRDALKIGLGIISGWLGIFAIGFAIVVCTICTLFVFGGSLLSTLPSRPTVATSTSQYSLGEYVEHGDVRVTVIAYEFSGSYQTTTEGYEATPPEGAKFLWIYVRVENIGENAVDAPGSYKFAIVYAGKQTGADSPILDRSGYENYIGGVQIFPGVAKEGWIRFAIPVAAEPEDIQVLFTPDLFFPSYVWVLAP